MITEKEANKLLGKIMSKRGWYIEYGINGSKARSMKKRFMDGNQSMASKLETLNRMDMIEIKNQD